MPPRKQDGEPALAEYRRTRDFGRTGEPRGNHRRADPPSAGTPEFVIGGFTEPQGTRSGLGALLLGYYDGAGRLTYAGKVGTGFDEAALTELRRILGGMERDRPAFARGALPKSAVHWAEPKLVGQVAFTEWTSAGQLRHPRYLGLRRDKDPASVTREVARS